MNKKFTIGSFYSGIGGIDLAFKKIGFEIKWSNETNEEACKIYGANICSNIVCNSTSSLDVNKLDNVDVITTGEFSELFSVTGYNPNISNLKELVFFDFVKKIQKLRPKILFLESNSRLFYHKKGKTFEYILKILEVLDYKISYDIINSYDYSDVPQDKEKIYILCFLDKKDLVAFDSIEYGYNFFAQVKTTRNIYDFLEKGIPDSKYYLNNSEINNKIKKNITEKYTLYQYKEDSLVKYKDDYCPPLPFNIKNKEFSLPILLDNKGVRQLTPKECLRLQGFDKDFVLPSTIKDSSLYYLINRSPSFAIVNKIAKNVLKILRYSNNE